MGTHPGEAPVSGGQTHEQWGRAGGSEKFPRPDPTADQGWLLLQENPKSRPPGKVLPSRGCSILSGEGNASLAHTAKFLLIFSDLLFQLHSLFLLPYAILCLSFLMDMITSFF